ncbi:tripartite tricarboxylate transporter permease [Oceanibacterium hippocampi]|uniref:Tripartite tricarboxylate transporter TctA family protein n=1 Tax=Oceanibacterium hippocampi TaxID=745714 RepID=A0A1Y5RZ23_9PROT|nr:tripartite tricarboxylate transporter permease [Oceanibacterium hippocampi]SLN27800.1 Tripartite tricarboxylate transporter TctA family protein [Oceanibacterium hippocampi]
MPEGLVYFGAALAGFATFGTLFHVLWATLLGITVGMLPGLTATLGVALMTTLTFSMAAGDAILILICMYVGAIYGGSRSAILLNIPGTPANAATTLDGFPLARSGRAGKAMGIATTGSVIGTMIGMFCLAIFAPLLAEFALKFGAFEFFWLAIFGVIISGQLTALDDPLKGWIAGFIGLLLSMVGQEGIHAYQRFTFGIFELSGGFALLPALVGTFGFAEIIGVMKDPAYEAIKSAKDSVIPKLSELFRYKRTIVRSGLIGTVMGLVPGVGEDMGAWVSYAAARRGSKEKQEFGKGSVEGLIAAETGNSAAVPGAIIPVLTLAVPGSAPAAVLLAALFIHGIRPGPLIMIEFPSFVFEVVAMVLMASLAILFFGLVLTRPMLLILQVARQRLMPIIFVLCTVGAFAIASRHFDIWVMIGFGVVGFVLREMKYPMAPLVLGIVLGPILDKSLRRGLVLSDGSLEPFLTRPISLVLWLAALITILYSSATVRRLTRSAAHRLAPRFFSS